MKILLYTLFFIALFSLLSCTGMKNLERPLPASNEEINFVKVSDGVKLFVYTTNPKAEYKTVIYIISGITGINHNAEKDIIDLLSNNNTNKIVVIHPRGTGYSEGKRGDIRNFSRFIEDYVEIISTAVNSLEKGKKIILYGHSMSTAIALKAAEKLSKLNGILLVNPPYKMKSSKGMTPAIGEYIKYGVYFIFAPHVPIVNMAGDPNQIENEEEKREAEQRNSDTLLVKYFSMYYMMEARKLMDNMILYAENTRYPLLLLYGEKDSIVDKAGCDQIYTAWGETNKKYILVPEGPHGKKTVFLSAQIIVEWLNEL